MDLLANSVQDYPWGSTTALAALLGEEPTGQPQAELWVGAHERSPSRLTRDGSERTLDEVISTDPVGELGSTLAGTARLPFLLKILAVEEPLSLQLHPDAASARREYVAQEAAGLAADSPQRSFPDPWPKPEMLYAISDFTAFCGFADADVIRRALAAVGGPQLRPVREALDGADPLRLALRAALRLPSDQVAEITARISRISQGADDAAGAPFGALSHPLTEIARQFPSDPAVVALLLMRIVTLQPGETLYVGPGQLHCYLAGLACEVQVNSNNVVRAGLTGKHVDVERVLELADTRAGPPPAVPVIAVGAERVFSPPVEDFALAEITDTDAPTALADVAGPALLMCVRGRFEVRAGNAAQLELRQGEAAFIADRDPPLEVSGSGVLLRLTGRRAG